MTDELLSNAVAAHVLHELLPEKTEEQWSTWLQNNRNQSRSVPYRIAFDRLAGGIFYRRDELEKFCEWEKARQLGSIKLTSRMAEALRAVGFGELGGSTRGRVFKGGAANLANDPIEGVYVQTIINEPLLVFAMTPDQAVAFGKELLDAGQAGKRIASESDNLNRSESRVQSAAAVPVEVKPKRVKK